MNRPGLLNFIIGHPVVVLALWLLTAYFGYEWYVGNTPVVPMILAGLVAISAANANSRVQAYRDWKREWDAMEGRPPSQPLGLTLLRSRTLRIVLGIAIWCLFACGALTAPHQPGAALAVGAFWLATALMVGNGLYRFVRRRPKAAAVASDVRDVPVTQCLKASSGSADLDRAFAALPEYCLPLLERSNRA